MNDQARPMVANKLSLMNTLARMTLKIMEFLDIRGFNALRWVINEGKATELGEHQGTGR